MGGDDAHGHNGFDRFFNCQIGGEHLLFREEKENTLWGDECHRNKNGHLPLMLKVGQFIGHEAEHIAPLLWELYKDGLAEGTLSRGREGIGQLFGRSIDIFYNWDYSEETIPPTDQFTTHDIGGDHTEKIEQDEETDDPQTRQEILMMKKIDGYLWRQRAEDIFQGIEDKRQDQKGDPDGKDDQDTCKDLRSKMFEKVFYHSLHALHDDD